MKFEKLIIENFSSFWGKHIIEFHNTDEKPITIIIGGSGKGKTSIFDALNWALYGDQYEPELVKESQKIISDFVNEAALQEAIRSDSSVEMACTLYFEHDEKHYRIQHAICVKQMKNNLSITDRSSSLLEYHSSGNVSEINYIDSFLNEILPNNVRDYFLFNGDRINKLALPGASREIRDGIYRVVDLELLENGVNHLTEVAKRYRRMAKDSSIGEMAEIENKYSLAFEELNQSKERLANLIKEKRALEDNIEILSEKLRGMDEIKSLQNRRDVLKERISGLTSSLKQIQNEIRSTAAIAIGKFALPEINILIKELGEKRQKGEIPSTISENLLQDILEIGRCICGTEFTSDDQIYYNLKNRLQKEKEKEKIGQDLLDLYYDLTAVKSSIINSNSLLSNLDKKRSELNRRLVDEEKEFDEILTKLVGAPEEEISKLATKLREYTSELTNVSINIQSIQNKINQKEDFINNLRESREELGRKQEKVYQFQLRDNLSQQASEELNRIFDKFADECRLEIQEYTCKRFKDFVPTGEMLKIEINPEFHYDIRDQNNKPAIQQLSQGQKQALSLAYITSISKVSEKNPPLVIDYPLGRLDSDVQENIALKLPELASQIILLVLPGTEWNRNTEKILRPYASDIYLLEFDSKQRQSSIIKES